jgi:signal transduction histidine kinase
MATFKTRARALDLLGRQQIAGIPTAINELFKNAHDAYADYVEVDYLRSQRIFILRDDGLGMTKNEFESRWLTLGTESKFINTKSSPPPRHPDKPERPMMGEKGIGRLAIASIGKQILVVSHALRDGVLQDYAVAFINWSIFQLPGLNLEDINVPVKEFSVLPAKEDIEAMKRELIKSIADNTEKGNISNNDSERIIDEIKSFTVYPTEINKQITETAYFSADKPGTFFYIADVDETLNQDIDGDKETKEASKIEKMLVGFTNTMTPDHPQPDIEVAFRDYRAGDGTFFNILDKEEFFSPEDFELADHHFQGTFDKYGQFSGTVKVYNEKEFSHIINWNGNNTRLTDCGSFSINVAYLQGAQRQSTVDAENFLRISAKAEKFGGLYIYKDNIRILPYGNSDYDFIDIEKNRTKSASYYFFSYRRMFGVIDISKAENHKLTEKSGREGFIENKAYRQVREILKNFFVQLAADFFREGGGPKSEFWSQRRSEQEKIHRAREKRDQQSKVRKDKFQSSLNSFFTDVETNKIHDEVTDFLNSAETNFASVAYINDPDEASQALLDHELDARQKLSNIQQKYKINQPRGFNISKDIRQDFEAYLAEYEKLSLGIYKDAETKIDDLITEYTDKLHIEISKRKRLEQAVNYISDEAKKAASQKEKEAREAVSEITLKVKELTNELMIGLENKIREIKDQFKSLKIDDSKDFDLVNERKRMEAAITDEKDRSTVILESIIRQLSTIYWEKDAEGNIITNDQINDSLHEELYELRDRMHADVELSQLGLAVGVIHHEFNSTVKSIRTSIRDLKAWADVNNELDGVYNNIRINFEHLDGYLTLFTPLNRRLYRKMEDISPDDLKVFLIDLFKARLERHHIQLKHTQGFSSHVLRGYRSTFYPVFVNIIDNAIHWLNKMEPGSEKIIRLHADDSGFYISNNGPEIPINDKERIFDNGFTRKLNGRGLGLNISREVLQGIGYNIFVDTPRSGSTVTFKIEPANTSKENA